LNILQHRVNRILNSWIGVILFLVTLFFLTLPNELALIPVLGKLRKPALQILLILLALIFIILRSKDRTWIRKSGLILSTMLYWGIYFIALHMSASKNYYAMQYLGYAMVSILLVAIYSQINLQKFLLIFFFFFLVYNTINNATGFFFNNTGMWTDSSFTVREHGMVFIGNVNSGIYPGMLSLFSGILYSRIYDRSWNLVNLANLLFSLGYAIVVSSVSQIVIDSCLGIVLILNFVPTWSSSLRKVLKWFNAKTLLVLDLLIFDAVVILGNSGWMEMIGINPRMHGRRELWDTVLQSIIDHPVIGVGFESWIPVTIGSSTQYFVNEHCFFLSIPYQTGLVGTAAYAVIVILCIIRIGRTEWFEVKFILGVTFGLVFLFMVNEVMSSYYLFLFLAWMYYIPLFLPEYQIEKV